MLRSIYAETYISRLTFLVPKHTNHYWGAWSDKEFGVRDCRLGAPPRHGGLERLLDRHAH